MGRSVPETPKLRGQRIRITPVSQKLRAIGDRFTRGSDQCCVTNSNKRFNTTLLLLLAGIALSACGGGDDDGGGGADANNNTFDADPNAPDGAAGNADAAMAGAHFIAVAEEGKVIAYTFDGSGFSVNVIDMPGRLTDIAASGTGYMIVGRTGPSAPLAMHSTDGVQWTDTSPTATDDFDDVAFGNDTFVVTTHDGAHRYHNGAWSPATTAISPSVGTQHSLAFIEHQGGRFVWLDINDTAVHLSSDGDTWTEGTIDIQASALTYSNGRLVAAGSTCDARYSDDGGATFSAPNTPVNCNSFVHDAASSGTRYVAVGSIGRVMHSSDGVDWSLVSLFGNRDAYGVAWNADIGRFMAVGRDSSAWISADGQNWQTAGGTSSVSVGGSYRLLAITATN